MSPQDWVPLRWSAGPLDVALRKEVTGAEREALLASVRPEALGSLQSAPFNCLVVSFAAGRAEDAAQQDALKPLIAAARNRGFDIVAQIAGTPGAALQAAQAAGCAAAITDKPVTGGSPLTVLPLARPVDAGRSGAPVTVLKDSEWPSVRTSRSGATESGPTGYPWVDSNGWMCDLARSLGTAPVWTTGTPKVSGRPLRPDQYAVAVADAGAFGARWVAALDPLTQGGLLQQTGEAREVWATVTKAVRFFEDKAAWKRAPVLARLGVLSDFQGENEYLAQEVLNLAVRRLLPVRIIPSSRATSASLTGLRAVLSLDTKPPQPEVVNPFLAAGGTLIVPPSAAHMTDGKPSAGKHETGYLLSRAGAGLIAVAPAPWVDPYLVAQDAHRILSRRNDVLRLWNAGSSVACPTLLEGGRSAVTHVVNYTGRAVGHPMSLWIAKAYEKARLVDLYGKSEELPVTRKGEGSEVNLPALTAYAAVVFSGNAQTQESRG